MTAMDRRAALAAVAVALGAIGLGGCDSKQGSGARAAFHGIDITGAAYAKALDLPDVDGRMRSLADWKGKVVVVFFGYTQCPDVCPTTMAELSEVRRNLGADGERLVGIFVTVDPERDTPALLKAYVQGFGPGMVGLRGNDEQTRAVAREFKVFYAKVPGRSEGSYTVDHTAGSYVFDTEGRVRLFTRHGSGPQALAGDIRVLLAESRP